MFSLMACSPFLLSPFPLPPTTLFEQGSSYNSNGCGGEQWQMISARQSKAGDGRDGAGDDRDAGVPSFHFLFFFFFLY
jgi:hypothetical protein